MAMFEGLRFGGVLVSLTLATGLGCGESTEPKDTDETTSQGDGGGGGAPIPDGGGGTANVPEDHLAPEFPPNSGQDPNPEVAYPAGPFGISVGSIIANYQFIGFVNSEDSRSSMQALQLADFYNPTGDGQYPEGSPYKGAKPKALLLDIAAVWCGPCQYEAKNVLPGKYKKYKALGGELFMQLADGPDLGVAAEPKHLVSWTTKYKVNYPSAIDPSYKLAALFESDAFPANFIVDTRTMTIVEVVSGVPSDSFWAKFEAILTSPN
jgi:hypothetical protein